MYTRNKSIDTTSNIQSDKTKCFGFVLSSIIYTDVLISKFNFNKNDNF